MSEIGITTPVITKNICTPNRPYGAKLYISVFSKKLSGKQIRWKTQTNTAANPRSELTTGIYSGAGLLGLNKSKLLFILKIKKIYTCINLYKSRNISRSYSNFLGPKNKFQYIIRLEKENSGSEANIIL